MLDFWVNAECPLLPLLPGLLWPGVVAPDKVLSVGEIELNFVLILSWIVWNRTVLTFNCFLNKNYTYTNLNSLKFNLVLNGPKKGWYAVKLHNQPTNRP